MNIDPELRAMITVYEALRDLEDDAKVRVIDWVLGKFELAHPKKSQPEDHTGSEGPSDENRGLMDFGSVADAFAAARPQSTSDKALVVAAYLQAAKGGVDISGREINRELTQIGYGVQNITRAVEPLIKKRPQLFIQTRKEGKTKQAQKRYKVTNEGFLFVKRLINRAEDRQ